MKKPSHLVHPHPSGCHCCGMPPQPCPLRVPAGPTPPQPHSSQPLPLHKHIPAHPARLQPAQGHVSSALLRTTGTQVKLSWAPAHRPAMGGPEGVAVGGHRKMWGPYCPILGQRESIGLGVGGANCLLGTSRTFCCCQLCAPYVWSLSPGAPQT